MEQTTAVESVTEAECAMLREFQRARDEATDQARVAQAVFLSVFGYVLRAHDLGPNDTIDFVTGVITRATEEGFAASRTERSRANPSSEAAA